MEIINEDEVSTFHVPGKNLVRCPFESTRIVQTVEDEERNKEVDVYA